MGIAFGSKNKEESSPLFSLIYVDTDWQLSRRLDDKRLPWYQITHIHTGEPIREFTVRDIKVISKEVEKDWEHLFPERVLK